MHKPARHELVWLTAGGWRRVREGRAGADADLLAHWADRRWPLVATRRTDGLAAAEVALGLAAPRRWNGRRLALAAALGDIERTGRFPTLLQAIEALPATVGARLIEVARVLGDRAESTLVYGSHGWQALTRLDCLRDGSDLDLLLAAPTAGEASLLCTRLAGYRGALRIDGELLLPRGRAVAWREWQRAAAGGPDRVLVKSTEGAELAALDALWPATVESDERCFAPH